MSNKIKLESGMYEEAKLKGIPFGVWLEGHRAEKGLEPTPYHGLSNYERLALKASMAAQGKQVPMDAYELTLAEYGIKAFGQFTDRVEKFFQLSDTAVLFPEFVDRTIHAAAIRTSLVSQLVRNIVVVQGFEYRKLYLNDTEGERQLSKAGIGGAAPRTKISISGVTTTINKFWREFRFKYEEVYMTPLNAYAFVLKRVGDQIGVDQTDDLILTLLNGDGNSNGLQAGLSIDVTTSGTITKLDFIKFCSVLEQPYRIDRYVGLKADMQKVWDMLSDMNNPPSQWAATSIPMPAGYEWNRSSVLSGNILLGVDSERAGQYVTSDTAQMTETEKLIRTQEVSTVVTEWGSFNVVDNNGIGAIDIVP